LNSLRPWLVGGLGKRRKRHFEQLEAVTGREIGAGFRSSNVARGQYKQEQEFKKNE
jgi:hypothetical protein